ncbi:MAG: phytanoyl-CoA dioxygenase family protein [Alphaproteobacteria bacterium]|nr:phytanoyl-CoA dioxygenase family protein [Alphaproteobacteria bacterium]
MNTQRSLTKDEIATFNRDGFLVARGLYDAAAVRALSDWSDEILAWPETPGEHMVYYEDSLSEPETRVIARIENFCPYHKDFNKIVGEGQMIDMVSQLLGEPAVLFKEKMNFKMPGGAGFTPHQDAQAGWNVYADFYITALVCIDAATVENGCLEMVRGFHDKGLVSEEWAPLDDNSMSDMVFEPCPTEPGDAIFFDSYAPHQSAPNLTANPRRVLYVTYNKASQGDHRIAYYRDKRASYPPDIERTSDKEYVFRV